MDRRIKHILTSNKSKEAINSDTYLNLKFDSTQRLLPPDELNKVLDIGEQFNKERQETKFYRISGKLNPLISNVLFNCTGKDSWQTFSGVSFIANSLDDDAPNLTYQEAINKHLKEVEGWYGYYDPILTNARLCNYFDMEPKRDRFSFIPDLTNIQNSSVKNWELTITYPYSSDTQHYLINGGIILVSKRNVIVGGKNMIALGVPIKHNLVMGSTVRLTGTTMDGDYDVKRVGLDNGDLKEYFFCIDVDPNIIIDNDSRMIKIYKDFPCEYYIRKFKKVKTKSSPIIETDDYEIYNLAFSENIYADNITQFLFNEDIDITDLVDNLNRPLSELYLSIFKTDSNNIFSRVSSGIEAPFIVELNNFNSTPYFTGIPIIQKIHNVTGSTGVPNSYIPFELDVKVNNTDFYGDVVEFNKAKLIETILADVNYRFNTVNRETTSNNIVSGPRPEGYYYKAHTLIKIRDFSSYIEQGTIKTDILPNYSIDLGDGRYIWRDLLDIGAKDIQIDTVDYPFVNGCHYLYQNYCFDIKRQDPFDNWGLFHSGFPSDPIGNIMTIKFKTNSSDNVC